ncbi:hypothetical protein AVEN_159404-1 [Araneus ventricosus]|uniref:Uncharacterized protein n=1 Tax=Araneus ventricosus TaxID=182803 RepID=A0A4Y2A0W4_ARAVE|nr:hypothetical protein AVEN_159404-1 [Araneus ventricosus]
MLDSLIRNCRVVRGKSRIQENCRFQEIFDNCLLYRIYHHSVVREIQTLLFSHKHIHLKWLKAYVGYLGNECADQLATEAITKSQPFFLRKPLSYLKSEIRSAALSI